MADGVKARRYESPRRREQAAATRRAILAAAQRLFERDGYAATTIARIAAEAGVAAKTVYLAFETKAGLLRALWHVRLRGDEADVPVGERSWYRDVIEETDPRRQVALVAHGSRLVKERTGRLMRVIRDAAGVDPDIDVLWRRIQSDFHAHQHAIVEAVARNGALRPGLDVDRAADVLWTVNHPEVWHLLVAERGWTGDEFEAWFAGAVHALLLTPD
jgi:AcrR family transcriptional regulator